MVVFTGLCTGQRELFIVKQNIDTKGLRSWGLVYSEVVYTGVLGCPAEGHPKVISQIPHEGSRNLIQVLPQSWALCCWEISLLCAAEKTSIIEGIYLPHISGMCLLTQLPRTTPFPPFTRSSSSRSPFSDRSISDYLAMFLQLIVNFPRSEYCLFSLCSSRI